jgi:hypothetical protein
MYEPAQTESKEDLHIDRENRAWIGLEQSRDDEREYGEHDPGQEGDHQKREGTQARIENIPGQISDRATLMAQTEHQCTEIVHGPHEDRPHADPDERWKPAPDHRQRGSDNRGRSRNRAIMMAEQDATVGRDEIHTIFKLARGDLLVIPQSENLLGKKPRIEPVAQRKSDEDENGKRGSVHSGGSLALRPPRVQKAS